MHFARDGYTRPDHDGELTSLWIAQSGGKEIKAGKLTNTRTVNAASSSSLELFSNNVCICNCRVLGTKTCSEASPGWLTNRCSELTAFPFPELHFVTHFLSMLNFRTIWFWTLIYTAKHRAILSIKQLQVENSYVKPPCFNQFLKYCLTYNGQAAKYFASSQLSLLPLLQSINLRAKHHRDFSNFVTATLHVLLAAPSTDTSISSKRRSACWGDWPNTLPISFFTQYEVHIKLH